MDHANVAWLEKYLTSQANVTCMIVSHDSGFLDTCCTDIYHYENRRLKLYRGNLSEFVKVWGVWSVRGGKERLIPLPQVVPEVAFINLPPAGPPLCRSSS